MCSQNDKLRSYNIQCMQCIDEYSSQHPFDTFDRSLCLMCSIGMKIRALEYQKWKRADKSGIFTDKYY